MYILTFFALCFSCSICRQF